MSNEKQKLKKDIEQAVKSAFPNCFFSASDGALGGNSFSFCFALQPDKTKHTSRLIENDPAFLRFWIELLPDGKARFEHISGNVRLRPTTPYYAFDTLKTGIRKRTATHDKIVKHMEKSFAKLKALLNENKDKLPEGFSYDGLI